MDGIPQGSALSCTLFLIFINDLPGCLDVQNAMFADDLVLWVTGTDTLKLQRKLNLALSNLTAYCELWKLKINCKKTVYTLFTLSNTISHTNMNLRIQDLPISKDENPCYLGIKLDPRLTLKAHILDVSAKVSKRLNLLKRLASTNWGANKITLRQLYTGYVRAVFDYSAPLQVTASKHNQKKLDCKQNEALRFVCGGLRSTPSSACEIDANVEPLNIRRERSAALTLERFKRMDTDNPCYSMTSKWKERKRIQKTSFLKRSKEIASNFKFPENRETITPITSNSPNIERKMPNISKELHQRGDKSTPPNILKTLAYETIDRYPPSMIKAYSDGSAQEATRNGGYGSYISLPQSNNPIKIYGPCGTYCNNYDAEIVAITKTIQKLQQEFDYSNIQPEDVVIFTDSQSALDAIASHKEKPSHLIEELLSNCHNASNKYNINITLQWIPGHSGIFGNEQADTLAKLGSNMPQPNKTTSFNTAKSLAKKHSKQTWKSQWEQNDTGRNLFKYQSAPDPKDAIHTLERKHQCNIFRLRTGHSLLNAHRSRLNPQVRPNCRHCNYQYETVEHHLLYCERLKETRKDLLPENPSISTCLYGNRDQLTRTSQYHSLAL